VVANIDSCAVSIAVRDIGSCCHTLSRGWSRDVNRCQKSKCWECVTDWFFYVSLLLSCHISWKFVVGWCLCKVHQHTCSGSRLYKTFCV